MDKRERLESTIAGYMTDRPPMALWRRFPGDDQRSADFAQAIIGFQQRYDWDFVNIAPADTYSLTDYGLQTTWTGRSDGNRTIVKHVVQSSLDWTELRTQDPTRGEFARVIEAIRLVSAELGPNVPLLVTVYSPLSQAARLAKAPLMHRHLRTRPERLMSGLSTLTESTLRFINALARTPISGICYVVEQADQDVLSAAEYQAFGTAYDQKILSELASDWWFNLLHLRGQSPLFEMLQDYPLQAVNWSFTDGKPSLAQGKSLLRGAVCGGVSQSDLHLSTPAVLRNTVREVALRVNKRRLILSADGAAPVTTPLSNLQAIRDATQQLTKGTF